MNILDKYSPEIKTFLSGLDELQVKIVRTITNNKPALNGERFLTNKDVCKLLQLSERTLQDHRDKGVIPFIKLEGKILYRESDIEKLLNDNFYPIRTFTL